MRCRTRRRGGSLRQRSRGGGWPCLRGSQNRASTLSDACNLPLYSARKPSLRIVCTRMSMGPFCRWTRYERSPASCGSYLQTFHLERDGDAVSSARTEGERITRTRGDLRARLDRVQRLTDEDLRRAADAASDKLVHGRCRLRLGRHGCRDGGGKWEGRRRRRR